MISFDLAYELTLGAFCAALRSDTRAAVRFVEPSFREGMLVTGALYVPSAMAALALGPAWQTMYVVDFEPTPAGLLAMGAAQTVALVALYVAGYLLGARAISAGRGRTLTAVFAVGWTLLLAMIFGVLWRRAFTVTTYAGFWAPGRSFDITWGAKDALLGGPLMKVLVAAGALNVAALVVLTRHLRAAGSRSRHPAL